MSSNIENDSIALSEVFGALRRGWFWIIGGVAVGAAIAVLAVMMVRTEYEARTTVRLRASSESGGGALAGLGGLMSSLPLGGLGGALGSNVETELQVITSRLIVGEVVDSLGLHGWVRTPERTGIRQIAERLLVSPEFESGVFTFTLDGAEYAVEGPAFRGRVAPGGTIDLKGALLTLQSDTPAEFALEIFDREGAIDRVSENLEAENTAGEIAELTYRDYDSRTAADVPNLLIEFYLRDRRTNDRGVNETRFEMLSAQADSLEVQLRLAETAYRTQQEASGVLDPQIAGEVGVERLMDVRAALEQVQVESRALQQLLTQAESGTLDARQLASYPTFLENAAINELLASLLEFETDRVILLQTRTERDEDVIALTQSIDHLEQQLATIARDYLRGLANQQTELQSELRRYESELGVLPGFAEQAFRAQREVMRLSETLMVMEAQLVQTGMAAVGEAGQVRQIDRAVAPRNPAFPRNILFLAGGAFGGLLLGLVGAIGHSFAGPRVRDIRQAEVAAGAPAIRFQHDVPLLLATGDTSQSVLVIGVGKGARPDLIAHGIAQTAVARGDAVTVVDLMAARPLPRLKGAVASESAVVVHSDARVPAPLENDSHGASGYPVLRRSKVSEWDGTAFRGAYDQLEDHYSLVITSVESLQNPAAIALLSPARSVVLVAKLGSVRRSELGNVAEALRRMGSPAAGIILHNGKPDGGRST